MKFKALAVAIAAASLLAAPAYAGSTTISAKDASGASITLGAVDNGAGGPKSPTHGLVDSTGTEVTNPTNHDVKTETADGADATQGSKSDLAATSSVGSYSAIQLLKAIVAALQSTSPTPVQVFQNSTGIVVPPAADTTSFLNMTSATTTKIISGSAGKIVHITHFRVHAAGTTTGKFVSGSGTNCGTSTADLSETWDLTASDGEVAGNGLGNVLIAPINMDVCFVNSAAVNVRIGAASATY